MSGLETIVSRQVPEKKEIDWAFIVLAVFITAVIVGGLILILTAPRNNFENFGNTAGTTRDDVLKWIGLYNSPDYKLKSRTSNVIRLNHDTDKNIYSSVYGGAFQLLVFETNKGAPYEKELHYIVPLNVKGSDKSSLNYMMTPFANRNRNNPVAFDIPDDKSIVPASNAKGQTHYFYINFRNNTTNYKVEFPSIPVKYSPWFCDTRDNNKLYGTTRVPDGYGVAGSQVRNKSIFERTCGTSANRPNTRRRLIYHKK